MVSLMPKSTRYAHLLRFLRFLVPLLQLLHRDGSARLKVKRGDDSRQPPEKIADPGLN